MKSMLQSGLAALAAILIAATVVAEESQPHGQP